MTEQIMLKILMGISLYIISLNSFAGPTPSVSHTHGNRSHTHPLPNQGVNHQHGDGAIGIITNRNHQDRPAPVYGSVITSTVIQAQNNQILAGELNCPRGSADCNTCATGVTRQFQAATRLFWKTKPWRFNWQQKYPPVGLKPTDIFDGVPAYALGIPDTHIQGFVRTNSNKYPYAGTHSHKRKGGVFVVKQESNGKKYLSSLTQIKGRHPSGAHIIGKYLVYGEGNTLVFKDINNPNQSRDIRLPINNAEFGGGLGVAKLNNNHHLIITTGPGGQDRRPRFNHFYSLIFNNGKPAILKFIGKSRSLIPKQWRRGFSFSENLSVITECGTGDIYTIHTSGDEKGVSAITGNGYWRLSKLVQQNKQLALRPVAAFVNRQNMVSCNVKASGTVHVNLRNKLEFYCHGYAKDPDGSAFNVLGRSSKGNDQFYFKVGTSR